MTRLVRCPKCTKILTEYPEIPVYQCGGCATILQAKNYKAPEEDANIGSPPINHQEIMSENGFSDSGSTPAKEILPSSSCSPSLKVSHEGEISVLNASSSQSLRASQANKENSLNEQDDINEVASGSLRLAEEGERILDPLGPGSTSEEDIVDAKNKDGLDDNLKSSMTISTHSYEGGISSSDDGNKVRHIPKSRRAFRNHLDKSKGKEKEDVPEYYYKRSEVHSGSLSESSYGTDDSDVLKIFNALSKEIASKYHSVGPERSFDSMEFQSAKGWLEPLTSDEDLLMKIDELRDALTSFVQRKGTKFSHRSRYNTHHVDQQPKASLLHHARGVSYGQTSNASDHSSSVPFLGPASCSCLHCQEERQKQFRFNASDVRSSSSPRGSLHVSEKSSVKEKPKRHCRPISQAAPFVICYNCKTLLHLPSDFLISRRKLHKLKCDACKEVLMLTFPERERKTETEMASIKLTAPPSTQWIAGGTQSRLGSRVFFSLPVSRRVAASPIRAVGAYADELVQTAKSIASPGRGILAIDESNATCGKRLASIGLDNTEANRQAYRELLLTSPGLGQYISGAILFEETLYQSTKDGKKFVDCMIEENITPGIKVDKGLVPLPGSNNESWCQGLDGLASRCAEYYKQGARFAKWRTVVSIPCGPSALAVSEAAWGLARYAAIAQDNGLVPIVEPEILLDGDHSIDRTLEVAEDVWAKVFYYLAQNNVMFEGILLKPSMVTPGAEHKERANPETIAKYTLTMLKRRVPPTVPGIMFLSGGQSEMEATLNLNAMNQSPNPWHVSFSYARALQNSVLKTWKGQPENVQSAQNALLARAKANSLAQLGRYSAEGESEASKAGMFQKGYTY